MYADALPPAIVKEPPTYRSLPDIASADNEPGRTPKKMLVPEPSTVQLVPSHLAMEFATLPPAVAKKPAAYRSPPDTASEYTTGESPLIPESSAVHVFPFHLAMQLAGLSPAFVNLPPAYKSPPDTASANTLLFIPEPNALQLL